MVVVVVAEGEGREEACMEEDRAGAAETVAEDEAGGTSPALHMQTASDDSLQAVRIDQSTLRGPHLMRFCSFNIRALTHQRAL